MGGNVCVYVCMCGHSVGERSHITWGRNIEDFASHLFHVLLIVAFITGMVKLMFVSHL